MSGPRQPAAQQDAPGWLITRLQAAHDDLAGMPEVERLAALERTVGDELRNQSEAEIIGIIREARDRLVSEARQRSQRTQELEEAVERMSTEVERLRSENAALRSGGATPAPRGSLDGGADDLTSLRDGLLRVAMNEDVNPGSLGLSAPRQAMFRVLAATLRHAIQSDTGRHVLLSELGVGAAAGMDTQMMNRSMLGIRIALREALEGHERGVSQVEAALDRCSRLLLALNQTHGEALPAAVRTVLTELSPQPLLQEAKSTFGHDHEKAWKAFTRRHVDLSNLSDGDIFERFVAKRFRAELARRTE